MFGYSALRKLAKVNKLVYSVAFIYQAGYALKCSVLNTLSPNGNYNLPPPNTTTNTSNVNSDCAYVAKSTCPICHGRVGPKAIINTSNMSSHDVSQQLERSCNGQMTHGAPGPLDGCVATTVQEWWGGVRVARYGLIHIQTFRLFFFF